MSTYYPPIYGDPYGIDLDESYDGSASWPMCRSRLAQARQMLHDLHTKDQVVSTSHDGRTVTYTSKRIPDLEAYINQLMRSCPDGYASEEDFNNRRSRGRAQRVGWYR